jgi:hypothetical protein
LLFQKEMKKFNIKLAAQWLATVCGFLFPAGVNLEVGRPQWKGKQPESGTAETQLKTNRKLFRR